MPGTPEGAAKAKQTNILKHGPDFYANIGSKSWDGDRSHKVGFALMEKEQHLDISKKGGQKTKKDYQKKIKLHEDAGLSTGTGK